MRPRLLPPLLLLAAAPLVAQSPAPTQLPLKRDLPPIAWQGCPRQADVPAPADEARAEAERLAAEATEASILGDNAAALQLLNRASALDPRSPRVAYRLASTLEQLERGEDALAEYCRFQSLAPDAPESGEVRDRIAALVAARGFTVPAAAADAYRAGIAHYEQGRLPQAESAFGAAAAVVPQWAAAVYNRGVVRLAQGRTADAARDFRRYLELSPGSADFGAVLDAVGSIQVAVTPQYNPGTALAAGLLVPGLGHFTTDRVGTGALFLGVAAGLAGVGVFVQSSSVECLSPPVDGRCPPDQVLRENTRRPLLLPALLGAAATGVYGAIDAYRGARRRNERGPRPDAAGTGPNLSVGPTTFDAGGSGPWVTLIRLRF